MKREAFISAVKKNAERVTHYQSGADGKNGGCDCIGLVIGAIRMLGDTWSGTHGSNYTARYELKSLRRVSSAADFAVGDLCFKAREQGDQGYALPSRYQNHADQRDYYHVGVVVSVLPLEILHCSDGGMHRDTSLGKWCFAGELSRMAEEALEPYFAVIASPNGGSVNLREKPDTASRRLALVLPGKQVQVLAHVNTAWAKVTFAGQEGYMMRTFLEPFESVTLTLQKDAALFLLQALKSSLGA